MATTSNPTSPVLPPVHTADRNALHAQMVYRTEDGRDASVVCTGPATAYTHELEPARDRDGGVRIAYLSPDGTLADPTETEFAFYTGILTPVRWLLTPTAVLFKDEDEIDEQPVGPLGVFFPGEDPYAPRPYDPDRKPARWTTRTYAVAVAASAGVPLREH